MDELKSFISLPTTSQHTVYSLDDYRRSMITIFKKLSIYKYVFYDNFCSFQIMPFIRVLKFIKAQLYLCKKFLKINML